MDGHSSELPVGIGLPGGGEDGLVGPVAGIPDAEHVLFVPVEIALGKALAGEGLLQQLHLLLGGLAVLLQGLGIDAGDDGHVLRPLHPALDLHAGHAHFLQLPEPGGQAVVLQAQGVIVHGAAHGVLHPAGLGAHAPVAAAAADQGGHIALAGIAHAQGAVDKDLDLDGAVAADIGDLLPAQLPGQHHPAHAHLRRGLDPGQIVQAHLGAGVQRDIRQGLAHGLDEAQVLDDDAVGPQVGGQPGRIHRRPDLPVVDQGVQGHIDLAAPDPAVAHGLGKFLVGEVLRAPAGVEVPHAQVHRVRAVLHGGDHGFGRSGGREKFHHSLYYSFKPAGPSGPRRAQLRYNTWHYNTQLPIATRAKMMYNKKPAENFCKTSVN